VGVERRDEAASGAALLPTGRYGSPIRVVLCILSINVSFHGCLPWRPVSPPNLPLDTRR
jgi:hypothetical protein